MRYGTWVACCMYNSFRASPWTVAKALYVVQGLPQIPGCLFGTRLVRRIKFCPLWCQQSPAYLANCPGLPHSRFLSHPGQAEGFAAFLMQCPPPFPPRCCPSPSSVPLRCCDPAPCSCPPPSSPLGCASLMLHPPHKHTPLPQALPPAFFAPVTYPAIGLHPSYILW